MFASLSSSNSYFYDYFCSPFGSSSSFSTKLINGFLSHDVIRAEFTLPPMLVEALFQLVVFIHRIHSQPHDCISRQAFEASRSLYESGNTSYWYIIVVSWLLANDLDINNVPPLRYKHESDRGP